MLVSSRNYGIYILKILSIIGVLTLHILGKDFIQNTAIYNGGGAIK